MPAAVWPAEDAPAESKAAPYANKAPQTGPTGSQAPHSPALGSFAADDPPRSAPPAGCTKKALPILAARRAWQIIPSFPKMTESPSGLAVERVFQQPARRVTAPEGKGVQRRCLNPCGSFHRMVSPAD